MKFMRSSLDICACTYPAFYSNSARIFLSVNSPGLITTIFNHPCRESHWSPPEIWERDGDILIQGWKKIVDFDPDRQTRIKKYGSEFEVMKLIRSEPSCVHLHPAFDSDSSVINSSGLITTIFKHPRCESHWRPPENLMLTLIPGAKRLRTSIRELVVPCYISILISQPRTLRKA